MYAPRIFTLLRVIVRPIDLSNHLLSSGPTPRAPEWLIVRLSLLAAVCFLWPPLSSQAQTPGPAAQQSKPASPGATASPQNASAPAARPVPTGAPMPPPVLDPSTVILEVGGQKITMAEYNRMVAGFPEQVRRLAAGPQRRRFAEQLARMRLLAQRAREMKAEEDPEVRQRIAFETETILGNWAYQKLSDQVKVDDAALQAAYEQQKANFMEVRARHILIRFKGSSLPASAGKADLPEEDALAKAQALRQRLLAGEDFATLAKEESDDKATGAAGGDLGTFTRGRMVAAFEKAAFELPVGEISEPVKSQFGFHIIRVEERGYRPLEKVRPDLERRLKPDLVRQAMDEMLAKAAIAINEEYFGPALPAMPAPPAPPAAK